MASLAALIGLAGPAAWPLFSTRVGVLRVQLLIGLAFAAHYALIGIATAAIVNVLGSLQVATVLLPLGARTVRYAGCGLIVVMAGATIASWAGLASLLVAVGQALIVIARMQKDVGPIFLLLFIGQLLWCVHDIVVGSPAAIAADAVGLLVAGWMLGRHRAAVKVIYLRGLTGHSQLVRCWQGLHFANTRSGSQPAVMSKWLPFQETEDTCRDLGNVEKCDLGRCCVSDAEAPAWRCSHCTCPIQLHLESS